MGARSTISHFPFGEPFYGPSSVRANRHSLRFTPLYIPPLFSPNSFAEEFLLYLASDENRA